MKVEAGIIWGVCETLEDVYIEKGLDKPAHFRVFGKHPSKEEVEIGYFTFAPMPGCCGVVVSTGSYLKEEFRHRQGRDFHSLKAKTAQALGYSCMVATVQCTNFPEVIGAAKNGWKLHVSFRNKRTTNDIAVMTKNV